MLEIEIKIQLRDPDQCRSDLLALGAKKECFLEHTDVYYNLPEKWGDYAKSDEALRLRTSVVMDPTTNQTIKEDYDITYKGPKLDQIVKSRIEHVCRIVDPQEMDAIVQALGFLRVIEVAKHREVYAVTFQGQDYSVLIDQVDGLTGWYLEAEIMVETEEMMETARNQILDFIKALNYDKTDSIRESYLELVLERRN